MEFHHFQQFVIDNAEWFTSRQREQTEHIEFVEAELGTVLPLSLKWLTTEFGYWRATGISSLQFALHATASRRPTLPNRYIVLAQPTAAHFDRWCGIAARPEEETKLGLLVLDTEQPTPAGDDCLVYWARGSRQTEMLDNNPGVHECDLLRFDSFATYVVRNCQYLQRVVEKGYLSNPDGIAAPQIRPMTLTKSVFETDSFLQYLGETISYDVVPGDNKQQEVTQLRAELHDPQEERSVLQVLRRAQQTRQYALKRRFTHPSVATGALSSSTWNSVMRARDLAGGRLLITRSDAAADSLEEMKDALPSPEFWVAILEEEQTPNESILVSWLPSRAIMSLPPGEYFLSRNPGWINDPHPDLVQHLTEAGFPGAPSMFSSKMNVA